MRNLIYYECEKQDQSGRKTHSSLKLANMIQSCPGYWRYSLIVGAYSIDFASILLFSTPTYPAFLSFEEMLLFEALTLLGLFRLLSLILIEVDEKAFGAAYFLWRHNSASKFSKISPTPLLFPPQNSSEISGSHYVPQHLEPNYL